MRPKVAPAPVMPPPAKYSGTLTRFLRGPRDGVAHMRRVADADVIWDFTGSDEYSVAQGRVTPDLSLRERALTPPAGLAERIAELDANGLRRE